MSLAIDNHRPVLLVTISSRLLRTSGRGRMIPESDSIERTRSRSAYVHKLCSSISYPSTSFERRDWFSPYPTYGSSLANERSHLDVTRNTDPVITPS